IVAGTEGHPFRQRLFQRRAAKRIQRHQFWRALDNFPKLVKCVGSKTQLASDLRQRTAQSIAPFGRPKYSPSLNIRLLRCRGRTDFGERIQISDIRVARELFSDAVVLSQRFFWSFAASNNDGHAERVTPYFVNQRVVFSSGFGDSVE